MKMTFRWLCGQSDGIHTTAALYQTYPNMSGVVSPSNGNAAGALVAHGAYSGAEARSQRRLELEVIESVNIHEDIKLGLPSRGRIHRQLPPYVARLGQAGVKVICYNFMLVFELHGSGEAPVRRRHRSGL